MKVHNLSSKCNADSMTYVKIIFTVLVRQMLLTLDAINYFLQFTYISYLLLISPQTVNSLICADVPLRIYALT